MKYFAGLSDNCNKCWIEDMNCAALHCQWICLKQFVTNNVYYKQNKNEGKLIRNKVSH